MQKIFIMGRLVKDAVTRATSNGRTFASFSVAVNTKINGDETFYYDVIWFNYSEKMLSYLTRGTPVIVNGDFSAKNEVSSANGQTYLRLRIFADSVSFPSLNSSSGNTKTVTEGVSTTPAMTQPTVNMPQSAPVQPQAPMAQPTVNMPQSAPAQPQAPMAQPTVAPPVTQQAPQYQGSPNDDLPF